MVFCQKKNSWQAIKQIRAGADFIDIMEFTDTKALEEIKTLILTAYQKACPTLIELD